METKSLKVTVNGSIPGRAAAFFVQNKEKRGKIMGCSINFPPIPVTCDGCENAPYIGENGNWYVGDLDTGVKAQGPAGQDADSAELERLKSEIEKIKSELSTDAFYEYTPATGVSILPESYLYKGRGNIVSGYLAIRADALVYDIDAATLPAEIIPPVNGEILYPCCTSTGDTLGHFLSIRENGVIRLTSKGSSYIHTGYFTYRLN